MQHVRYHYQRIADVEREMETVGVRLPLAEDVSALNAPIQIRGRMLPNRLAIQPMEGSDSLADGSPGELTRRRYQRFASGGAALIWFEAVAIAPEVRASPNQLYLNAGNVDAFTRLVDEIRETALREQGYAPMVLLQAAHSGRYSRPDGQPAPIIACNNPALEDAPIDPSRIVTDDQLRRYEDQFASATKLAHQAGFDGIDIKACHRYLISELLSAYTRPGAYGGSFENRTRFLLNAFRAARAVAPTGFLLTTRLNAYDGFPRPWGFGVAEEGLEPDLTEPIQLVRMLVDEMRLPLLNVTAGNPYKNPHVNRPYDQGNYVPDEHPFEGLARMARCFGDIQRAFPNLPVIGSGLSYLRQFAPQYATGLLRDGCLSIAGFGRLALACPSFARQTTERGGIEPNQACISCGRCAQLLRAQRPSGCVVRDGEVYSL